MASFELVRAYGAGADLQQSPDWVSGCLIAPVGDKADGWSSEICGHEVLANRCINHSNRSHARSL